MLEVILYVLLVLLTLEVGAFIFSLLDYPLKRIELSWEDGFACIATVKRKRFLWPSRNVTFGAWIFDGGPEGMNDPTLRHEAQHVRQYREKGWTWVWFNRKASEADARSVERSEFPTWRTV